MFSKDIGLSLIHIDTRKGGESLWKPDGAPHHDEGPAFGI